MTDTTTNSTKTVKVLVVDDDALIRTSISHILKQEGYSVTCVGDGLQALEALKTELPEIIIADLVMPNIDGIQLCQQVKAQEQTKHIPFIMVTAFGDEESEVQSLNAGVDEYLVKPINPRALLMRVYSMLRLKHVADELRESNRQIEKAVQQRTAELQRTLRFLYSVIENPNVWISAMDSEGRIILWNEGAENITGYKRKEILGKSAKHFNYFGDRHHSVNAFIELLKERGGKLTEEDVSIETKSGEIIHTMTSHSLLRDPENNINGALSIRHDTTRRVNAERELKKSNWRLNLLNFFANKLAQYLDLDQVLDIAAHFIQEAVPRAEAIRLLLYDETLKALVVKKALGFPAPESLYQMKLTETESFSGRVFEAGESILLEAETIEELGLSPENASLFLKATGGKIGGSHLMIVIKSYQQKFGLIVIHNFSEPGAFSQEDMEFGETIANQLAIALRNAQLFEQIQSWNADLERKVAERTRELRTLNAELVQANCHKSEFLATMSHELRTPLNAIIGFSEVVLSEGFGPLNEKQKRQVASILKSGKHLLSLINDILDLSKIEAGKMELALERFSLPLLLKDVFNVIDVLALKKEITLEPPVIDGDLAICADKARLVQILYNLLHNAVKFTLPGGRVAVEVTDAPDFVKISVLDNGIGIDPKDQERIFNAFEQVDGSMSRHYEGTGLGLNLVRKLVHMHRGTIWVESSPGQGSRFTFTIPKRLDTAPLPTSGQATGPVRHACPVVTTEGSTPEER
jgi:PAS domain S-box-containing protein